VTVTPIEWTDRTWNPVRGCRRVSPGCEHCYAERQAHRFSGRGQPYEGLTALGKHGPKWTGRALFVPEMLGNPLHWRKPQRVLVNSMSDLFHDDVTNEQIAAVFAVMAACPQHTFQVLTKRPERALEWFANGAEELTVDAGEQLAGDMQWCHAHEGEHWPLPNVWLGVSCEDQERADERIPLLLKAPTAVRFISAEPLLDEVCLDPDWLYPRCKACGRHSERGKCCEYEPDCTGGTERSTQEQVALLDWVIVGGESGPGARPCNVEWISGIVGQCNEAGVPCFVKQLGAHVIAARGRRVKRDRKGGDPSEWPHDLRVRQFPRACAADIETALRGES
jgi:protein gp37